MYGPRLASTVSAAVRRRSLPTGDRRQRPRSGRQPPRRGRTSRRSGLSSPKEVLTEELCDLRIRRRPARRYVRAATSVRGRSPGVGATPVVPHRPHLPGRSRERDDHPAVRPANEPPAAPCRWGSGRASADGISHACFRFSSGNGMPRRVHSSRSHDSVAGSTAGVSSHAAAIASRVRSSGVGPSPPVETTMSARDEAVAESGRHRREIVRQRRQPQHPTPSDVRLRASSAGIRVSGVADRELCPDAEKLSRQDLMGRWHTHRRSVARRTSARWYHPLRPLPRPAHAQIRSRSSTLDA